jgi:hypothetical protein
MGGPSNARLSCTAALAAKRPHVRKHLAKLSNQRVQVVAIVALGLLVSTRTHEKALRSDFNTPNAGNCREVAFDTEARIAFAADISEATDVEVRRFNGNYYRKGQNHWRKLPTVVRAQMVDPFRFFPTVCVAGATKVETPSRESGSMGRGPAVRVPS